jgi:hypothetical protein|tara:strand:+ start:2381 stop:3076 length:696 start_codon:yes stop_codon:yes gene_type:complete
MKKMNFRILGLAVILAAGVSFTSCEKDESQTEPTVGLKFNTVTSSVSLKSTQARELSFTSGFITLREVQFQIETDNDSVEVDFNIELNTQIDFATGETDPDISYAEIPAGTYNEMEVEIELQDEGDSPAMVLNGTYVDADGVSHDVRFEFNSGETFEVEKEGTITFATNASALAQVTFDPTAWFADVENEQLSNATKDNEGVIVISETQNANIFDVVADGLDLATEIEIEM